MIERRHPDDILAMWQRDEARKARAMMEQYRGRYASHEELVSSLHAEMALPPRGRFGTIEPVAQRP